MPLSLNRRVTLGQSYKNALGIEWIVLYSPLAERDYPR